MVEKSTVRKCTCPEMHLSGNAPLSPSRTSNTEGFTTWSLGVRRFFGFFSKILKILLFFFKDLLIFTRPISSMLILKRFFENFFIFFLILCAMMRRFFWVANSYSVNTQKPSRSFITAVIITPQLQTDSPWQQEEHYYQFTIIHPSTDFLTFFVLSFNIL